MKIESKYNIKAVVYYISEGVAVEACITHISSYTNQYGGTDFSYYVNSVGLEKTWLDEEDVFPSIEALKKHHLSQYNKMFEDFPEKEDEIENPSLYIKKNNQFFPLVEGIMAHEKTMITPISTKQYTGRKNKNCVSHPSDAIKIGGEVFDVGFAEYYITG